MLRAVLIILAATVGLGCGKSDSVRPAGGSTAEASPAPVAPSSAGPQGSFEIDCASEHAPQPKRDPAPMCHVVGGVFWMGSGQDEGRDNERPRHKVAVSSFYLDQHEVTNAQMVAYLNTVGTHKGCAEGYQDNCFAVHEDLYLSARIQLHGSTYSVDEKWANHPFEEANWYGALRYCEWAGKRLAREAEWEYAARHDPRTGRDLVYPWGNAFDPSRVNCWERECTDGFAKSAPVGQLEDVSPFGVRDLGGNVPEWVADCHRPYAACDGPCPISADVPACEGRRVARGGSYSGGGAVATRAAIRLAFSGDGLLGTGVRCAR